jgi:AAA domain
MLTRTAIENAKRGLLRSAGDMSADAEPPPHTEIPEWVNDGPGDDLEHHAGRTTEHEVTGQTAGPSKAPPLKLTYFDDCGAFAQKRSILKGIIARGETSAWIAPPGAGKSALLAEISVHCAAQIDWRGHKAKEACGVVVLALERGDLFKRRFRAYFQRDGLHGLPIAVADAVIDLLNPACVDLIVATVRAAEQQFGCSVGLVVIDTYAKGIAANGGDEDKARDQNRAAANLRNVHGRLDVHIALVGLTGKDESRGARGSNAHVGDVDVMVQISGDTIKVAQVIKGNDQPERAIAEFKLEAFELGRDEDGDPITTSIVSPEQIEARPATSAAKSKQDKLPPIPKAALKALFECIADSETTVRPEDIHVPVGVTCVTLEKWRERLAKLSIINREGNHREQFKRIHVTLKSRGFIGIWGDIAWPVT